jgi:glycosyltransferase involved in cell wall biosynthesis
MAKVVVIGSLAESLIIFRGPLLLELGRRGHDVIACAPHASLNIQKQLQKLGVKYHHIPFIRRGLNPIIDLYSLLFLVFFLRDVKPDNILSYTVKPVIYGSLAGQVAQVPRICSIITGRGYVFSNGDFKQKMAGKVASLLYKICLRSNHKVFFQNPDDIKLFIGQGLLKKPDQAVLVNGSGVDTDFYKPVPLPKKVSFLLIARLIKDKGVYEYIEAARVVKQKYPEVIFYLAGPIEIGPNSVPRSKVDSWCFEKIIKYCGALDDVRPALGNASVYVLPSYCEGTPRTVLEAMSIGRPIITTDVPGCRETVREGLNGFFVPVADSSALAGSMIKFIEQPELIPAMGHESRKIALEKYDVHKVNAVIIQSMGL